MRRLNMASLAAGAALALIVVAGIARAQAPTAARQVEPVIITGERIPDWSGPQADVVCMPYPSGALTGARDAHNGTDAVPPGAGVGVPVNEIVAYRWDLNQLQFVEIPVQVDEKYYFCLSNPNSDFGVYSGTDKELTYAWDVESWKKVGPPDASSCSTAYLAGDGPKPDPVANLDDDDEIVFLWSDAGPQAPIGAPDPPGTTAMTGHGLSVVDPLDPANTKFVYLFLKSGGSSFNAANGYVSYLRDPDADEWIDKCSFRDDSPEKLGTSNSGYGPNLSGTVCRTVSGAPGGCPNVADHTPRASTDRFPRDGVTVSTASYEWHASGRWMVRSLAVAKPGQPGVYGPDLIDRWKGRAFQQSPDSQISLVGFEDEQVNWEANDSLLGERRGPVRAIREAWGADSGTNVTKTESFYRDAITYHYHVRVHPIPPDGLYTSWDYNRGVAAKYYNRIKPDGVDVDGMNDDTGNVDGTPEPLPGFPAYFDAPDPTFNAPSALLNWEQVSGASDYGSLVYIQELKGATTAENPAVVPYYRDDSCLDDGTGDNPVPRPWPGEGNNCDDTHTQCTYDQRVLDGYCAAAGKPSGCHVCRLRTDPGPCDVDCKLAQIQGAYASHGTHYFFTNDTDNAASPEVLTEIDAQQWQFMVPTAAPTNVGEPYGNTVVAPVQVAAVPLFALPIPTTTTTTSTTSTTGAGGSTTTTIGGPTTTTTLPSPPNPTPPSASNASVVTDEDTAKTVTLSGSDLTDCDLTFAIVTPPAHGSLGAIANNACAIGLPMSDTGAVPYTPSATFHGNDSFTYKVNDGTSDSSPATVSITVKQKSPPVCATGPIQGCRQPSRSQKSSLTLKDRTPDSGDHLVWKWNFGTATSMADYGDPLASTNYELCVFDADGRTIGRAGAPPGRGWRRQSTQFTYRSRDHAVGGKGSGLKLKLREGPTGRARIVAQGNGVALDLQPLPATQPIIVQLKNNDNPPQCWEATFSAPARRNAAGQFSDRND
jgi:hypothetical protein